MSNVTFSLKGESLTLLPQKAILWPAKEILIVSDVHLGKAGHFRKNGIPITKKVHIQDIEVLQNIINKWSPSQVMILGDLFHSFQNKEWGDFVNFIEKNEQVRFVLVKGNHDILGHYPSRLKVVDDLHIAPFYFSHEQTTSDAYNISGHIHPGVKVFGSARQNMTLACFWFSNQFGILPAFGAFTGLKTVRPKTNDHVFGILNDTVIDLNELKTTG